MICFMHVEYDVYVNVMLMYQGWGKNTNMDQSVAEY